MSHTLNLDTQNLDTQNLDTQNLDTQNLDIPKTSTPKTSNFLIFSFFRTFFSNVILLVDYEYHI
jgi:hypothetical protein